MRRNGCWGRSGNSLRIDRSLSTFFQAGIAPWACGKRGPGRDLGIAEGARSRRGRFGVLCACARGRWCAERRRMRKASDQRGHGVGTVGSGNRWRARSNSVSRKDAKGENREWRESRAMGEWGVTAANGYGARRTGKCTKRDGRRGVAEEDIGKRGRFAGEKSIDTLKSFACKAVTL